MPNEIANIKKLLMKASTHETINCHSHRLLVVVTFKKRFAVYYKIKHTLTI